MLTRKGFARRQLLTMSAQSALLYYPLSRMFRDSEALAADGLPPSAIFCYYPLGFKEQSLTFSSGNPISSFSQIHKPIETLGLKNDFLFFDGLQFLGCENHNGAHPQVLAGWGKANADSGYGKKSSGVVFGDDVPFENLDSKPYSLDQQLADKWKTKSAVLGVKTAATAFAEAFSFKADGSRVWAEDNPATTFKNFFGNFKPGSSTGSTGDAEAQKKVVAAEKRIIDYLTSDIKRIEKNLGSEDRAAFQAHLSGLDSINKSIVEVNSDNVGTDSCDFEGLSAKVSGQSGNNWWLDENKVGKVIELNRALIVQMIACGVTRVAVLQVGTTHSTSQLRATGISQKGGDYHELSHGDRDGFIEAFAEIQTALIKEFAQMAVDLKNTKVGTGNLFDSTLMMVSSCGGNDSGHQRTKVPAFLLGKLGGKINSGRAIKATHYNNLLVTVAHAVGETGINYVGNKTKTGPIAGVLK